MRRPRKALRAARVGGEIDLEINPQTLCAVFGIDDPIVATRLLSQLVSVIQSDPDKPVASIDNMLALIEGIGPGDTIEAMTATMLVGAQHAALDSCAERRIPIKRRRDDRATRH